MMTDSEILRAIKFKRIKIEPFDKKRLGSVSYDITIKIEDVKRETYRLISLEKFTLARNVVGMISPRSRIALKGIFTSFSALVDPGYSGHLIFLAKMDFFSQTKDLFQIMFFKVGEVNVAYNERESSTAMNRKEF